MISTSSGRAAAAGTGLKVLTGSGIIQPYSPLVLAGIAKALRDWGTGPAGGFAALAVRCARPGGAGRRARHADLRRDPRAHQRLARGLAARGVGEGDGVAVMCRNHRGFVDATLAIAKLGADVLYLNTAFAAPQLVEVLDRERPEVVVHDEEFAELLARRRRGQPGPRLDRRGRRSATATPWSRLIEPHHGDDLEPPEHHARVVILTSGTTGTPKGAPRSEAGIDAAVSLLARIPLRHGWRTHIAAPLFHTWGFAHLALAMLLGSTVVLRRRFDPEECLRVTEAERCDSLVVIPVMLQRILALPEETLDSYDLSRREGGGRLRLGAARGPGRCRGWTSSATTSTTSTARPRSPTRASPPPRTCGPRRARPAGRRHARW